MTGIVHIDGICWEIPLQYCKHYLHPQESRKNLRTLEPCSWHSQNRSAANMPTALRCWPSKTNMTFKGAATLHMTTIAFNTQPHVVLKLFDFNSL